MEQAVYHVQTDATGTLVERPNRFLALVDIEDPELGLLPGTPVHVHDPGRLRELLYPGNRLLVRRAPRRERKTHWDLVAGRWERQWVIINSAFHRYISELVLSSPEMNPFGPFSSMRAEVTVGHSRLDFVAEREHGGTIGVEVKGCTLTVDGTALFPDAPTVRGRKHLVTLMDMIRKGEDAGLLVLIFRRDSQAFAPKKDTDPEFAMSFYEALKMGLEVHPLVFGYDPESGWISLLGEVPLLPPGT